MWMIHKSYAKQVVDLTFYPVGGGGYAGEGDNLWSELWHRAFETPDNTLLVEGDMVDEFEPIPFI